MRNCSQNLQNFCQQTKGTALDLIKTVVSNGRYAFVIILVSALCEDAAAQKIDSLKALLPYNMGIKKCDLLYQLAYECIDIDNKESIKWANESLKLARVSGDSLRIVKASRIKALGFRRLGLVDSSFSVSAYILPIARRNKFTQELKYILNGLTMINLHKSFYDKALKYSFESLELREKHGIKSEISDALFNVGMVYFKLEDLDEALNYYLRSLEIRNHINYSYHTDILLINISLCYAYKGNINLAKKYVEKAMARCIDKCSEIVQMHAEFALGLIAYGGADYINAEVHFQTSFQLAKQLNSEQFQLDNIVYLTQTYLKTRKVEKVKWLAETSETLLSSKLTYNQGMIQVYSELIKVYEGSGELNKVKLYQKKYIELKDSLYSYQFTRNLMRAEADYIGRENKSRIEAQNNILMLNKDVIVMQRFVNVFIGIVALLLIILAFILVRMNRHRRTANQWLESRVRERTRELEVNRDLLERSLEEHNIQMERISIDVKRGVATMKGLCILGLKDREGPDTSEYIDKIDYTSDQLLATVDRFINA